MNYDLNIPSSRWDAHLEVQSKITKWTLQQSDCLHCFLRQVSSINTHHTRTQPNLKLVTLKAGKNKSYFLFNTSKKAGGKEVGGRGKQGLFANSFSLTYFQSFNEHKVTTKLENTVQAKWRYHLAGLLRLQTHWRWYLKKKKKKNLTVVQCSVPGIELNIL